MPKPHVWNLVDFGNRRIEWVPSDEDRAKMDVAARLQAVLQFYTRYYESSPGGQAPVDQALREALTRIGEQFAAAPDETAPDEASDQSA